VASKLGYGLLLVGVLANPSLKAQQTPSLDPSHATATIHCHGEPYVSVTADAEQAVPLQVVATVDCDEQVLILSDPQGYTVKVRTANGKIGYVTRFQVTIETSKQVAAQAKAPAEADPQAQGGAGQPDRQDSDSSKPRIYVSDTESWMASGGFGNPSTVAPGNLYGGYNPEMVDIYQDFTSDCPAAVVTQQKSKADYVVLFDKQSSKKGLTGLGGLVKVNKVTVLSKNGETLLSETSHSVDTAVKMACDAVGQRPAASSH
jgi:hypothetical protein